METEKCRAHTVLREDYRTLLRLDAQIEIPNECQGMRAFYEKMLRAAVRWAEEQEGEETRSAYAACETIREKSRFQTRSFRLEGTLYEIGDRDCAVVCRSTWIRDGEQQTRCSVQFWDLSEQTILPIKQVLRRRFGRVRMPKLGYRADGCYPQNGDLVFFRNPHGKEPYRETIYHFEKNLTNRQKRLEKNEKI